MTRFLQNRWPGVVLLIALLASIACTQPADLATRTSRVERSRDYDVQHYTIRLRLDDTRRAFAGETRIAFAALRDEFSQLVLDAETFTVDGVHDAGGDPLAFEHRDGKLAIRLVKPLAYGEGAEVRVRYHADGVQPDPREFGMDRSYPLGLRFHDATAASPPVVKTMSFPEGARHWFPCYDHPNDKATSDIIVTVREDFQVIANGRLKEVTRDGDARTRTFHWRQEKPHSTYLFVIVAGTYVEVKDPEPGLPISYWIYQSVQADAERSFGRTREIIRFFESEFGVPYPWAKYDQIIIPGIGGGAESTSATVIGDIAIQDARADQDFPVQWLVAHEAAHQWWGNLVTMRDWTHTWIHEAFATYYDNIYIAASEGEEEGAIDWLKKRELYLEEVRSKYRRPIVFDRWEAPNQNFDRHTYQKGALVVRMLRDVLGEAAYRRTIKHFLEKHAYQSADTHDFLIAIRESTGQVLDWFFEQWIYGPGHPVLSIQSQWLEREAVVEVRISQTQEGDGQARVFEMPVEFGIVTASGKRTERVWLRQREQVFRFAVDGKPLLLRFDEGNHLLCEFRFEKPVEELLYQLDHDDVTGRIRAADQLRQHRNRPEVLEALRRVASSDRFWGVRREALRATAGFEDESLTAFWQQRALDPRSAVRVVALQLLASKRDPQLRDWFLGRSRAEDSYLAQAEALRALGGCGSADDLPDLRAAALQRSPRDVVRMAALQAIAELSAN